MKVHIYKCMGVFLQNALLVILVAGSAVAAGQDLYSSEILYSNVNNCGSAGGNCSGYVNEQVSFNQSYDKLPKLNNTGDIVWQSRAKGGNYDILLKPASSEAVLTLSSNSNDDTDPRINDSGDVTWMGWDGSDWEIFLYKQGSSTQITSNAIDDKFPKINNAGEVVWIAGAADERGKIDKYEVYFYSGEVQQITSNDGFNVQARLNDSGDLMWRTKVQDTFDIYTQIAGVTQQVTSDDSVEAHPQITNSGHLVWERNDGNDDEIMVMLSPATSPVQITNDEHNDCLPSINDNGIVAWQKFDGNDTEIYVYANGAVSQLTDNDFNDTAPLVNARGDVIWLGNNGTGNGVFIYQSHTRSISKLSDIYSGHYNPIPDLNDLGHVVWSGSYDENFEITISSPK